LNPYENLKEDKFWRQAVAAKSLFDISSLWEPKFEITQEAGVVTFGSCFAQHISGALQNRGFNWLDGEPAPVGLSAENKKRFNYGVFSVRTGNIYSASLLLQWLNWASGKQAPPDEVWKAGNTYLDPFRPNIEPMGFQSIEELSQVRKVSVFRLKKVIEAASVFVFTLGLTEGWYNKDFGYEYPMCPGTVGGEFDSSLHCFKNQNYSKIFDALEQSFNLLRQINPSIKLLLTVSPVPLTATASDKHVLVATMHSKSILRAAAGEMAAKNDNVDYFPSYEIICSPAFKGVFFEPNMRSVNPYGVNFVMNRFFDELNFKFEDADLQHKALKNKMDDDVICEEIMLEAFRSK